MKKTLFGLIALLVSLTNAENLFKNGDFEKTQSAKPYGWNYTPKNNIFGQIDNQDAVSGKNSIKITVPAGKEGTFLFDQGGRVNIPPNTPIKLSGWFKSEKYRTAKGKKSIRGISMKITFADGSRTYPTLFFRPTKGKWQYKEQIFTFPKKVTSMNYAYLMHTNASGTVKYDNLFFGPWTKKDKVPQTNPLIAIPEPQRTPVIDGKLDDQCWQNAARMSDFVLLGKKKTFASNQTEVFMTYDANNLYIATRAFARVLDPVNQETTKFRAKCKKRDSSVFNDDSLEIFISPTDNNYYHFAYNSLGTRYDSKKIQHEWNTQWEVKTSQNERAWLAEIRIPWKSLGITPAMDKVFKLNFCRNEPADKESSSWVPVQTSFHEPASFATAVLGKKTVQFKTGNLIISNVILGPKVINFDLKSTANSDVKVALNIFHDKKKSFIDKSIKLAKDQYSKAALELLLDKPGNYKYNYSITNKNNGKLLFRSPLYGIKATIVKPVEVNLKFNGKLTISVNGKKLDSNKFFLKKGINELNIKCFDSGSLIGEILLPDGLDNKPELFTINANVKGTTIIKRKILLKSTKIEAIWVEQGLHVLRNASQHAPLKIQQPTGKTLELIIPESFSLVGIENNGKILSYDGLDATVEILKPINISGKNHKFYKFTFTGKQIDTYIQAVLYKISAQATTKDDAIYFRVKSNDTIEVWNKVHVKVMPAITGNCPKTIGVDFWHAFGVGVYNQEQANELYKDFGQLGFNSVSERVLCYDNEKFYSAAQKARLKVFAEFNMYHQFRCLFNKYPEFRGVDINGKSLSGIRMQPTWFYGPGRSEAVKIIADFVKKYKPYAIQVDHEVPPLTRSDVSPAAMKAFAQYAKLSSVPDKKEIQTKYKEQWIDFSCWTWGKVAEVLKEGVKKGNPDTLFSIYSAYQAPDLMGKYSCNWKYLKKHVDVAMMGYGAQTEKIKRDTLEILGNVPAYFGVAFWQETFPGYGKQMKNVFIRRVIDSGSGVMEYNWSRFEGISKTKIAEACNIISKYEDFFAARKRNKDFSTSGDFSLDDVVILKHNKRNLIVVFNSSSETRKGVINFKNKKHEMEVKPYDVSVKLLK